MLITTAVKTSPFSFTIPLVSGTGAEESSTREESPEDADSSAGAELSS